MIYQNIQKRESLINDVIKINFNNGAYVEVKGEDDDEFYIEFIDSDTGKILHETILHSGYWSNTIKKYFINWRINIYKNNKLIHQHNFNCENKKVYVKIDSFSLGDNLAWLPYIEEFRKKHNSIVYVDSNYSNIFEEQYTDLIFVGPNTILGDLYATYKIGWYYDEEQIDVNRNKIDVRDVPFQQTGSEILGIDFEELKPKIKLFDNIKKEKQVSIAIHGSAQSKYWNNPTGWQEVVDYLNTLGYKVKLLSREQNGHCGNYHPTGVEQLTPGSIEDVIKELQKSELFIGIGSGLSWVSWATNTPTILISGFSEPHCEPISGIERIYTSEQYCRGCFNNYKFDVEDWNWCPVNKDTDKQFECSKSITSDMVIEKIKLLL